MFQILTALEDTALLKTLCARLEDGGYRCYPAQTGEKTRFLLDCFHIDALVAGWTLPHPDGLALTKELRQARQELPILILLDEDSLEDKRKCFLAGADDCVPKTVHPEEVNLRVGALLRRAQEPNGHLLRIGEMQVDYDALTVSSPDGAVLLPKKEMGVLFKLLSAPSCTFTRRQLVDELWGLSAQVDERTVDVHVKRLREKFGQRPEFRILTIRGIGYRAQLMER